MKRPSFQFYPADWLRDTALRTCSVEARGLWIDMICYMHEGNPYGYLKVNQKVILPPNLAAMVGLTLEKTEGCLNELLEAGVVQKMEDETLFSKRMIRDEDIRNRRAAGGKLGGNPNLKKVKGKVKGKVNQNPTPSSSSSSNKKKINKKERKQESSAYVKLVELCELLSLENAVNPTLFDFTLSEYRDIIPVVPAVRECLYWCKANGKKKVTIMRIRNWFKNAKEFARAADMKRKTELKDNGPGKPQKPYKRPSVWTPPK